MSMDGRIQKAAAEKDKQLATKNPAQIAVGNMNHLVERMMPAIKKALPSVITPERFSRIVMSAISTNPQLAECSQQSFLGAMMTCAQLGIEPNTPLGQGYLIPYRMKGQMTCQFQLGYKGLMDLAYRSGKIVSISAHVVHENDTFEYELGLEPVLNHKPCMTGDRGAAIAYYATYKTKENGYGFEVMSRADVEAHRRKFSKAFNSPWDTNFDEMAKKTVLKKLLKYAPMSIEFQRAVAGDGGVREVEETFNGDVMDEPIIIAEGQVESDQEE